MLNTKVSVTSCGLDLNGTFLDGNKKKRVGTVPMKQPWAPVVDLWHASMHMHPMYKRDVVFFSHYSS